MFNIPKLPACGFDGWPTRLATLVLVGALSACGSSVKLDDAPVEDRSTSSTGGTDTTGGPGAGTGVDARNLNDVVVPGIDVPQPGALAQTQARVVYFDYDSFVVRADSAAVLESNARFLKANPNRRVGLEGHTDELGSREYNIALGQKRAEAVRRALSLLGVNEAQMEPVSFGEERPAALGQDESSYAKNRRVEVTYR
jgi:peptidoglycan-associated lipoprotein